MRPHGHQIKCIPKKIGNNSALWRFDSMQQALDANSDLIAQFICNGKEQSMAVYYKDKALVASTTSEEP